MPLCSVSTKMSIWKVLLHVSLITSYQISNVQTSERYCFQILLYMLGPMLIIGHCRYSPTILVNVWKYSSYSDFPFNVDIARSSLGNVENVTDWLVLMSIRQYRHFLSKIPGQCPIIDIGRYTYIERERKLHRKHVLYLLYKKWVTVLTSECCKL